MNPLNKDRLRFGKLYRQFEEEVLEMPNIQGEATTRTPYMKDLTTVFYTGTAEEYAKQLALTYVALAHDYYRLNRVDGINEAFKEANKQIKSKMENLNPNKASLLKDSAKSRRTSKLFFDWLKKHKDYSTLAPRLLDIETEYKNRINSYNAQIPKYWNAMYLKGLMKNFEWIKNEI